MAVETEARPEIRRRPLPARLRPVRRAFVRFGRALSLHFVSSLTRRILVLNLAALIALVTGILYLNQFRQRLIDAEVESLTTQGEIIAGIVAWGATVETNVIAIPPDVMFNLQAGQSARPQRNPSLDFSINPVEAAPLVESVLPPQTRARIYDPQGLLLYDSKFARYSSVLRFALPPAEPEPSWFERAWQQVKLWFRRGDLPLYQDFAGSQGLRYQEVSAALSGAPYSMVRATADGDQVVSVAVPIQNNRALRGALLLSTEGDRIDQSVAAEQWTIIRMFLMAAAVTIVLSVLLAGTIAAPLRRLAGAADRVRRGVKLRRHDLPDLAGRPDEIGHLARSFRDMTDALHARMEAIESFAADVSHELKNPLTSLRSAVETLPLAKTDAARTRLLDVIQHDVRRLDRLITDISDASRLDAELAREGAEPIDVGQMLERVVAFAREIGAASGPQIELDLHQPQKGRLFVLGHESRLAQVINNLIDNARSFTPPDGLVRIEAGRDGDRVRIVVEDTGPGIRAENLDRIFERFYTDRPSEGFGNNSGLGLSISRQIVEAHHGTITAENRTDPEAPDGVLGARFVVLLPAEG